MGWHLGWVASARRGPLVLGLLGPVQWRPTADRPRIGPSEGVCRPIPAQDGPRAVVSALAAAAGSLANAAYDRELEAKDLPAGASSTVLATSLSMPLGTRWVTVRGPSAGMVAACSRPRSGDAVGELEWIVSVDATVNRAHRMPPGHAADPPEIEPKGDAEGLGSQALMPRLHHDSPASQPDSTREETSHGLWCQESRSGPQGGDRRHGGRGAARRVRRFRCRRGRCRAPYWRCRSGRWPRCSDVPRAARWGSARSG
jgi:hypothetical protein